MSAASDNSKQKNAIKTIKVALIEDDDWIRDNLASQIAKRDGFVMARCYNSGEQALAEIAKDAPDVVMVDINLPNMNGIECVRKLKALMPEVLILMLTAYEDSDKIFKSLLAGASGYLLKRTPQAEIIQAIEDVHKGNSPMSGHIARKVVQYFHQRGVMEGEIEKLSNREREVLERLAEGAPYKEIADNLSLSIDTVRMHIKGIYSKLHVHSRGEAVAKYLLK
jgi:DNA-binding NarL/FixJ family response regulator